jgi:cell wall-associated NlpC family hydrolase
MPTTAKIATASAIGFLMLVAFITATLAALVGSVLPTGPSPAWTSNPSQSALADIPGDYLAYYEQAATTCSGLDWSILAAIGKIESNHGRSTLPGVAPGTQNVAGAGGPMQQLEPTWNAILARHHIPPGGASPPSRYNPHDAIWAAAFYLCDSGAARGDLHTAIFAYNHADWYVHQVLAQARRYRSAESVNSTPDQTTSQPPTAPYRAHTAPTATVALAFARAQIGQPYTWGGNRPTPGGFDCSGLTHAAYAAAGIQIPRTAQTQYNAGPLLPAGTPAQPGDLIFFGTPGHVHHVASVGVSSAEQAARVYHVALYVGGGQIIEAVAPGIPVRTRAIRLPGPDGRGGEPNLLPFMARPASRGW